MVRMRNTLIAAGLLGVLLPAMSAMAVTEEEAAKMRAAMPDKPAVVPQRPRAMLVFNLSEGFKHSCIPYWAKALDIMAEKTGAFTVEHSSDKAVFASDTLSRFDAVCFNNTTDLKLSDAQKEALTAFIKGGKGIVGIHAATDNFKDWPEGRYMMGGVFQGHPWEANGTWAIKLDEPDHPLLKSFGGEGFKVNDEIYRTNLPYYSRDRQRVLMSLDMSDEKTRTARGVVPEDMDTGISWIKPYGKGRLFYCSLGHNHHLTWTTPILEHYLAGIQYALGDLKVDDSPLGAAAAFPDKAAVQALVEKIKSYDWGQSRADLTALQDIIRQASGSLESLKSIELLMQPLLAAPSRRAAQDFACRQLSVFATAASVPALAVLLDSPETEHMARYVLERITDPSASAALLEKLPQVKDNATRIGIVTSLGVRRCSDAVGVLGRLAADDEKPVARAAVQALGKIGTPQAAAVLRDVQKSSAPDMQTHILHALALCADRLAADGRAAEASALYETLYAPDNPALIRIAALTGLSRTNPAAFNAHLLKAIVSSDRDFQAGVIRLFAEVKDTAVLETVAAAFAQLPVSARVQTLAALASNGHPVGRRVASAALDDSSTDVRIAAYQTLGVVGDGGSVIPLAEAAAGTSDRLVRDAARQALYQLRGDDVAGAIEGGIVRMLDSAQDEATVVELIRAVGERRIESSTALLFKAAGDARSRVSQEAIRTLQVTVSGDDMPAMAKLLAEKPGAATENAAIAAAEKIEDRNRRAAALLTRFDGLASDEAKVSYLRVLGRLGDVNALGTIRRMRDAENPVIREAAFRAMTDWPGMDFFDTLGQLAQDSPDETRRILAFRAYIRLLAAGDGKTEDQSVSALAEAMKLINRPQEQRLVLSAIGNYGTPEALRLALAAMDDPELKTEAEAAVVSISQRLAAGDPEAAMPAIRAVVEQTTNQRLRQQSQRLLRDIENRVGFIVRWAITGPYTEANKGGSELFDVVFAPEKGDTNIHWQPMPMPDDSTQPWLMDILKMFDGTDRAAYARTVIVSPGEADAVFEIGSDDGVKVWLNGTLVHANDAGAGRAVTPGEDKVPVRLKAGDNTVLLKITQGSGDWGFCLRVTRPDGSPMTGLSTRR